MGHSDKGFLVGVGPDGLGAGVVFQEIRPGLARSGQSGLAGVLDLLGDRLVVAHASLGFLTGAKNRSPSIGKTTRASSTPHVAISMVEALTRTRWVLVPCFCSTVTVITALLLSRGRDEGALCPRPVCACSSGGRIEVAGSGWPDTAIAL